MKRYSIQTICLLIFITNTFAQDNKIDFGLNTAPTTSLMYGKGVYYTSKMKFGYMLGLSARYNYDKMLSIETGLYYESKGATDKITYTNEFAQPIGEPTIHDNFEYLIVPVLFQFKTNKQIKFFFNAGSYFGYLIKATSVTEAAASWPEFKWIMTDNYEKFDFGLSGGIGAEYHFKTKFIFLFELRDNLGLMNLSKGINAQKYPIRTNSLNLIIGFKYKIFKND